MDVIVILNHLPDLYTSAGNGGFWHTNFFIPTVTFIFP